MTWLEIMFWAFMAVYIVLGIAGSIAHGMLVGRLHARIQDNINAMGEAHGPL